MKSKLLIVDHAEENLFTSKLKSVVAELETEIFRVESAPAALDLGEAHDFALAILDTGIPAVDGFALAERMRGSERTASVPIIFVSAESERTAFAFRGYESGAVDVLYKPVDVGALRSKVRVFIELDQQRKALVQAKDAAEAANHLKSAFLANMSHEIRTPLGAMLGFAELLEDRGLGEDEKLGYSRIIRKNGQLLLRLIDDVLDLSKVEAGRLNIEKITFSPGELAAEVLDLLRRTAEDKGVKLELELSPDLPSRVISDPTRLRQILMNIVGNALKFTRQGEVNVKVAMSNATGRSRLVVLVEDTGVGIDAKIAARLFQSFVQADNSTTRRFGGTGLGLVLSKRLAQGLGGDVRLARSELDRGSAFEISVHAQPVAPGPETRAKAKETAPVTTPKPLADIRILVAEDSEDNQILIRLMLNRYGAVVEFASDGLEAVDKALRGEYDVVLMDIQMPSLDGYGATRKLRQEGFTKPIIALTAHAMNEERVRCLDAGCSDHLSKPIDWKLLLSKVSSYARPDAR